MTKKPIVRDRKGFTHRFNINKQKGTIILNMENGKVVEIFVIAGKLGSTIRGLLETISISINIGIRYGIPIEDYIEKFKELKFTPCGKTTNKGIIKVNSIMDYVSQYVISKQSNGKTVSPEDLAKDIKKKIVTACSLQGGGCGD